MPKIPPIVLYNAKVPPRLRTAVDKLSLGVGDYAMLQNVRSDTQAMIVRNGETVVRTDPPPDSTGACKGAWSGTLNGASYLVTAWQMSAGGVALFTQNPQTGAYTEITNAGNATASSFGGDSTGNSRFTSTNNVVFSSQTSPPAARDTARDVLVASNGADYPIVYDPTKYFATYRTQWCQDILVPTGANNFQAVGSLSAFWQVCGSSGKTYIGTTNGASGLVNGGSGHLTTHFALTNSSSTYTSTNAVIDMTLGTSVRTGGTPTNCDVATVEFSVAGKFLGPYLNIIFEGTSATIQQILKDCRIDMGTGSGGTAYGSVATWTTIYDGTSSNITLSSMPILLPLDAGNNRWMMSFPLAPITAEANRQCDNIRFLWLGATAPGSALTCKILMIASCGIGGGYPWGTQWAIAYSGGTYTWAESAQIVQSNATTDYIVNCGGPRNNDASLNTPITLPGSSTSVFYDYRLLVKNDTYNSGAFFPGGPQGHPTFVDFYFNTPAEIAANPDATPLYMTSVPMWVPATSGGADGWANARSSLSTLTIATYTTLSDSYTFGYGAFDTIDYLQRNPSVFAPSDFNLVIPAATVIFAADNRLWAGNNFYSTGTLTSELKFSDKGFFARFRSIGDPTDVVAGSRLVFSGETIMAGITTAAASQGATTIYIWTDKSFNALGSSGGSTFIGSGVDSTTLATRYRISTDGTLEPGSIDEYNSVLFWVTSHGEIARFDQGGLAHISYRQVTNSGGIGDLIASVPASRRGKMVGVFANQRYHLYFTPAGGSYNTNCLIWNEPSMGRSMWGFDEPMGSGYWESLDTLDGAEVGLSLYDSSVAGDGKRVFVYDHSGTCYAYEENTKAGVNFEITSRGYQAVEVMQDAWDRGFSFHIKEVESICVKDEGRSVYFDIYPAMSTDFYYRFPMSLDAQQDSEWLVRRIMDPESTAKTSWSCYFDIHGLVTSGTKFMSLAAYPEYELKDGRGVG